MSLPGGSSLPPAIGAAEIAALVEPTRVHRRAYTDRAVFDLEMARIFGCAWIFVAHSSQIPQPNDLIRTRLGLHDVLVTRDADGRVHVVENRCTHSRHDPLFGRARQCRQPRLPLSRVDFCPRRSVALGAAP